MISSSPNPPLRACRREINKNLFWFQQDSVPSVVNLIGSKADLSSTTLAQRLGKNCGAYYVTLQILVDSMIKCTGIWFSICVFWSYLAYLIACLPLCLYENMQNPGFPLGLSFFLKLVGTKKAMALMALKHTNKQ